MADIAEVIAQCLREISGLLCYLGNGVFCCVIDSKHKDAKDDLTFNLENEVHRMGMVYRSGRPVSVEFEVGEPATPSPIPRVDSTEIMQKAIRKLIANDQQDSIRSVVSGKIA